MHNFFIKTSQNSSLLNDIEASCLSKTIIMLKNGGRQNSRLTTLIFARDLLLEQTEDPH